jgi:hypothetical protein
VPNRIAPDPFAQTPAKQYHYSLFAIVEIFASVAYHGLIGVSSATRFASMRRHLMSRFAICAVVFLVAFSIAPTPSLADTPVTILHSFSAAGDGGFLRRD